MRAVPTGPVAAPMMATGLPLKGCSGRRDSQSMAFFRPPGMLKLYSGLAISTASAERTASASGASAAGQPDAWSSAL